MGGVRLRGQIQCSYGQRERGMWLGGARWNLGRMCQRWGHVCVSVSVWDAMNSLGYNAQQARNSKAAYDVMGNCEWLLDRVRESSEMFWKTLCPWQCINMDQSWIICSTCFRKIVLAIYWSFLTNFFHDLWIFLFGVEYCFDSDWFEWIIQTILWTN